MSVGRIMLGNGAPHVTSNAIAPSLIATDMIKDAQSQAADHLPLGRHPRRMSS